MTGAGAVECVAGECVRDIVRVIGKGRDVARSVRMFTVGDVFTVSTDSGSVSMPVVCDYPYRAMAGFYGQENGWPGAGDVPMFDPVRLSGLCDAVAGVFPRKADPCMRVSSMTVGKAMAVHAGFDNVSVRGLVMPRRV